MDIVYTLLIWMVFFLKLPNTQICRMICIPYHKKIQEKQTHHDVAKEPRLGVFIKGFWG